MLRHHKFGQLYIWTLPKTCNQSRRFAMHITKEWVEQTNHHFLKPPVKRWSFNLPPTKTRNLFTQGQNPDSNRSSENKWAQKGEAQICYVLASAKKNGRTQNRMLSFATQKMHLFGASCCPEWSSCMVLLNHVRHFGVNCLLFGAVVGLECNSCIYNR